MGLVATFEVPVGSSPPLDDLPANMTDLELFKEFCMPLEKSDLWADVARLNLDTGGSPNVFVSRLYSLFFQLGGQIQNILSLRSRYMFKRYIIVLCQ